MKKLFVAAVIATLAASSVYAQDRAITKIKGDVYRFQNRFHFSVFTVTGNGVVVTDPINAEAATAMPGKAMVSGTAAGRGPFS